MPFNVQFGVHEEPRLRQRMRQQQPATPSYVGELFQGIVFGLGILMVLSLAYFAISTHVSGFPDLPSLKNYWLGWH